MRSWLLSASLAAVAACGPVDRPAETNQASAANQAAPAAAPAQNAGATTPAPAAPQSEWRYESRTDPMTDRATRTACVWSSNEVQLGFPYGNTRAELCLRDSPQFGHDAYVALEGEGQILCYSYSNCTVQIRFDSAEARAFTGVGASDNSTNIVFIRGRDRLQAGLRSAARTAIQIEFYQAGRQALLFPTAGFNWPPGR